MKTVMTKDWQAPAANIQRSSFNRSHGVKTTFDVDELIPILVDEVLPGDTFNLKTSGFARLSTPIYPIMDNMYLDTFYFFVPMRLVWENSEQFFGEDIIGGDGNAPLKPMRSTNAIAGGSPGTLEDYMGIPVLVPDLEYDELPIRAYYAIWNEWFRSQDLQDKVDYNTDDTVTDFTVLPGFVDAPPTMKRNKKHDYFTSCLPWPQKRGEQVTIPILNENRNPTGFFFEGNSNQTTQNLLTTSGGQNVTTSQNPAATVALVPHPEGWNSNAGTINQLRFAEAIQRYYERDARGGTRYPEVIKSHFNVSSDDHRLQRPEYLGGGSTPVNISPIASTNENPTDGRTVGDLGAMGTVNFQSNGFVKSFTEHGFVIGLANVRADITYQQGLNKLFNRETRFEYYWPSLAHLGEQEVRQREIYAEGSSGTDNAIFGYQERWAEYRYKPSSIHGLFRSYQPTPIDQWHLSQEFTTAPTLNSNFIESNTPLDRAVAVPSEPHFIADFYHQYICARPIPIYSVPGWDRF
jgi:hypothetical protein